jgi:hypothetical protein
MGRPFVLGQSRNQLSLLKLHGSIDWVVGKVRGKKAASLTEPINEYIARVTDYPRFNDVAGDWFIPYLVPPTAYKRYEPGLLALWKAANSALFNADHIIVIGYSMPLTDWTSVSLLRLPFRPEVRDARGKRPVKKNLVVVNPSEEVLLRFRDVVDPSCEWVPRRTEEVDWESVVGGARPSEE